MVLLALTFNCFIVIASSISCGDSQNGSPPQTCGPSNSMTCSGFEQCATDTLICESSQSCTVECIGGTKACYYTHIDASESSELSLTCLEGFTNIQEGCKSVTIDAPNNGDVDITCNEGQYSCSYLTLNAQESVDVKLSCNGFNSCQNGVEVHCGSGPTSGTCDIECNDDHACHGLQLDCGSSDCAIKCVANGCFNVIVDASNAASIDCSGTASSCQYIYNNLKTAAPTSGTNNPTSLQTNYPTTFPTNNPPTYAPTLYPITNYPTTQFPTKFPTKFPTTFPTQFPTKTPTISPTKVPTSLPTNVPTKFPSKFPSKLPTKSPTSKPTIVSGGSVLSAVTQTKSGDEAGVDEKSTTTASDINRTDDVLSDGDDRRQDWVYVLLVLLFLILCAAGIIVYIGKRKKKLRKHVIFNMNEGNIDIGATSPTITNVGQPGQELPTNTKMNDMFEQHLVNNVLAANVLMDDVINQMQTPMGTYTHNIISIEMNTNEEGTLPNCNDEIDDTPSDGMTGMDRITVADDTDNTDSVDDDDVLDNINDVEFDNTPMGVHDDAFIVVEDEDSRTPY